MESVNIKDIAKLAGVGVSTVSRAINNHPDVNKETKARIMEIIQEYNYVPNNSARNLKRTNSNTIGVMIKGITNPFFTKMIKVIEQQINARKYSMLLHQVDANANEIDVALELSKEKRLKGLIFLGANFEQNPDKIAELKTPFVIATATGGPQMDSKAYSSVTIDDFAESYKAVDYLCKLGHEHIGIICGAEDDRSISRLRIDGYFQALKDHRIPLDLSYVKHNDEFTLASGYTSTAELLFEHPEITAIYSVSDIMAIGVCKAILDSGKRVPEDYSVMGFDGVDFAQFNNPSITTIKQPDEEMALESVRMLFDLIQNKKSAAHKIFPAYLVEGESCARPREKSIKE